MTDDLRSTLEAAVATEEAKEAPVPAPDSSAPAPSPDPVDPPAKTDAPEGDPAGETPESSPENQPGDVEGDKETPKEGEIPRAKVDKAPQSWKPAQREKWDKLDPDVKQEITRREREVNRVMSETSNHRRFVEGFKKTVAPFTDRFRAANVAPEKAIASLLHVDHTLATGSPQERAQMAARLILDYGVDFQMLDEALSGAAPQNRDPVEAKVAQLLEERLKPFQSFMAQTEQQKQAAIEQDYQKAQTTIEQMAEDTEKFPLFETVRQDMADIIEINSRRGVYLTPEDAYNRAVHVNPEASAQVQEMAKRAQAKKANESAQRALGASLSVTGSPSGVKSEVPASDLRGTIEAAIANASGR